MQVHETLSISQPGSHETKVEQYSAVLGELSNKRPADGESDTLYFDGEVTEYSDHETDFEIDVVGNPVQRLKFGRKCVYHPSI
ncbi:hypothetical protein AVEN_5810-1 [Araneus ventricosus]|uniref:Uncharacterized protein n=1 Tax=Araneus ventricosus TaxID=182803 RepID=A0A4Y2TU01_ARAVE|nr:hypothetical protein AVEN_5810-1 [Araneus ventricosus]